jgi:SAM-dependent methyltransferase
MVAVETNELESEIMPGTSGEEWDQHYREGLPPWETGGPSSELARVVGEEGIRPCRVLELGCGSAVNAVWLAQQGFDVTAVDFSPLAIEKARERVRQAGVRVELIEADVTRLPATMGAFPFFFDRGCYHAVRRDNARGYVEAVLRVTAPGAIGLILAGNAKSTHAPGQGPPVVSEEELRADLEPAFQIVRLREFTFDRAGESGPTFLAWSCLLRRPD